MIGIRDFGNAKWRVYLVDEGVRSEELGLWIGAGVVGGLVGKA